MRLLIDMNLSPRWVDALAAAGISAVHWMDIGSPHAPDRQIMDYAAANTMIVLTHDLDFSGILAATRGMRPSVVQIRSDEITPEAMASILVTALLQVADDLAAGALLTIDPKRSRLRLLPLR